MKINRSKFKIPKMDCPAEEQMIRTALDDVPNIRLLDFDLADRILVVWHNGNTDSITERLTKLNLGATLLKTMEESESNLPTQKSLVSDRDQARVLWILLGINGFMFIAELVSGWLVESAGLIADSLDMLADAAVYGISLYAVGKAARHKLRTAHISGWFQFVLVIGALFEVVRRFIFGSE
ncbi:MAG: cation transporter, partial [Candidatus Zixiibacteriota bacterium]